MQIRIQKHYHTIGSQLSSMSTTVLRVRIRLDLHHFVGSGLVSTVEPAPIRISPPPLKDRPGCRKHWTNWSTGQTVWVGKNLGDAVQWEEVQGDVCWAQHKAGILHERAPAGEDWDGTPTKRQVSKRQVSKRLVSKRLVSKHQVYKTSGLQNVRFQNVWFQNV